MNTVRFSVSSLPVIETTEKKFVIDTEYRLIKNTTVNNDTVKRFSSLDKPKRYHSYTRLEISDIEKRNIIKPRSLSRHFCTGRNIKNVLYSIKSPRFNSYTDESYENILNHGDFLPICVSSKSRLKSEFKDSILNLSGTRPNQSEVKLLMTDFPVLITPITNALSKTTMPDDEEDDSLSLNNYLLRSNLDIDKSGEAISDLNYLNIKVSSSKKNTNLHIPNVSDDTSKSDISEVDSKSNLNEGKNKSGINKVNSKSDIVENKSNLNEGENKSGINKVNSKSDIVENKTNLNEGENKSESKRNPWFSSLKQSYIEFSAAAGHLIQNADSSLARVGQSILHEVNESRNTKTKVNQDSNKKKLNSEDNHILSDDMNTIQKFQDDSASRKVQEFHEDSDFHTDSESNKYTPKVFEKDKSYNNIFNSDLTKNYNRIIENQNLNNSNSKLKTNLYLEKPISLDIQDSKYNSKPYKSNEYLSINLNTKRDQRSFIDSPIQKEYTDIISLLEENNNNILNSEKQLSEILDFTVSKIPKNSSNKTNHITTSHIEKSNKFTSTKSNLNGNDRQKRPILHPKPISFAENSAPRRLPVRGDGTIFQEWLLDQSVCSTEAIKAIVHMAKKLSWRPIMVSDKSAVLGLPKSIFSKIPTVRPQIPALLTKEELECVCEGAQRGPGYESMDHNVILALQQVSNSSFKAVAVIEITSVSPQLQLGMDFDLCDLPLRLSWEDSIQNKEPVKILPLPNRDMDLEPAPWTINVFSAPKEPKSYEILSFIENALTANKNKLQCTDNALLLSRKALTDLQSKVDMRKELYIHVHACGASELLVESIPLALKEQSNEVIYSVQNSLVSRNTLDRAYAALLQGDPWLRSCAARVVQNLKQCKVITAADKIDPPGYVTFKSHDVQSMSSDLDNLVKIDPSINIIDESRNSSFDVSWNEVGQERDSLCIEQKNEDKIDDLSTLLTTPCKKDTKSKEFQTETSKSYTTSKSNTLEGIQSASKNYLNPDVVLQQTGVVKILHSMSLSECKVKLSKSSKSIKQSYNQRLLSLTDISSKHFNFSSVRSFSLSEPEKNDMTPYRNISLQGKRTDDLIKSKDFSNQDKLLYDSNLNKLSDSNITLSLSNHKNICSLQSTTTKDISGIGISTSPNALSESSSESRNIPSFASEDITNKKNTINNVDELKIYHGKKSKLSGIVTSQNQQLKLKNPKKNDLHDDTLHPFSQGFNDKYKSDTQDKNIPLEKSIYNGDINKNSLSSINSKSIENKRNKISTGKKEYYKYQRNENCIAPKMSNYQDYMHLSSSQDCKPLSIDEAISKSSAGVSYKASRRKSSNINISSLSEQNCRKSELTKVTQSLVANFKENDTISRSKPKSISSNELQTHRISKDLNDIVDSSRLENTQKSLNNVNIKDNQVMKNYLNTSSDNINSQSKIQFSDALFDSNKDINSEKETNIPYEYTLNEKSPGLNQFNFNTLYETTGSSTLLLVKPAGAWNSLDISQASLKSILERCSDSIPPEWIHWTGDISFYKLRREAENLVSSSLASNTPVGLVYQDKLISFATEIITGNIEVDCHSKAQRLIIWTCKELFERLHSLAKPSELCIEILSRVPPAVERFTYQRIGAFILARYAEKYELKNEQYNSIVMQWGYQPCRKVLKALFNITYTHLSPFTTFYDRLASELGSSIVKKKLYKHYAFTSRTRTNKKESILEPILICKNLPDINHNTNLSQGSHSTTGEWIPERPIKEKSRNSSLFSLRDEVDQQLHSGLTINTLQSDNFEECKSSDRNTISKVFNDSDKILKFADDNSDYTVNRIDIETKSFHTSDKGSLDFQWLDSNECFNDKSILRNTPIMKSQDIFKDKKFNLGISNFSTTENCNRYELQSCINDKHDLNISNQNISNQFLYNPSIDIIKETDIAIETYKKMNDKDELNLYLKCSVLEETKTVIKDYTNSFNLNSDRSKILNNISYNSIDSTSDLDTSFNWDTSSCHKLSTNNMNKKVLIQRNLESFNNLNTISNSGTINNIIKLQELNKPRNIISDKNLYFDHTNRFYKNSINSDVSRLNIKTILTDDKKPSNKNIDSSLNSFIFADNNLSTEISCSENLYTKETDKVKDKKELESNKHQSSQRNKDFNYIRNIAKDNSSKHSQHYKYLNNSQYKRFSSSLNSNRIFGIYNKYLGLESNIIPFRFASEQMYKNNSANKSESYYRVSINMQPVSPDEGIFYNNKLTKIDLNKNNLDNFHMEDINCNLEEFSNSVKNLSNIRSADILSTNLYNSQEILSTLKNVRLSNNISSPIVTGEQREINPNTISTPVFAGLTDDIEIDYNMSDKIYDYNNISKSEKVLEDNDVSNNFLYPLNESMKSPLQIELQGSSHGQTGGRYVYSQNHDPKKERRTPQSSTMIKDLEAVICALMGWERIHFKTATCYSPGRQLQDLMEIEDMLRDTLRNNTDEVQISMDDFLPHFIAALLCARVRNIPSIAKYLRDSLSPAQQSSRDGFTVSLLEQCAQFILSLSN